ncbi:MAG: hypothetical protein J6J21_04815 [Clostridia bacterium]|nr:hypothetical protein [Clostridia bacterium]
MAEYSYIPLQTVEDGENLLFMNGDRCCRKGYVVHNNNSGVFRLKGAQCRARYRVTFDANIAVAADGTLGPISVALVQDGEELGNAVAIVVPVAIGDFNNVSLSTFVDVPCGCCAIFTVENTSDTPIDVTNANIIIERVA